MDSSLRQIIIYPTDHCILTIFSSKRQRSSGVLIGIYFVISYKKYHTDALTYHNDYTDSSVIDRSKFDDRS